MKRLFLLFVFAAFINVVNAQAQEVRRGHVGINFGPSFLTNSGSLDYAKSTGFRGEINMGYRFTKSVGIATNVFTTSYKFKNDSNSSDGIMAFVVGPLFSTASNTGKVEFDFKPMVGYGWGSLERGDMSGTTDEGAFTFIAQASLRWNVWNRVSFTFNVDYHNCRIKQNGRTFDFSACGVGIGAAYRFK